MACWRDVPPTIPLSHKEQQKPDGTEERFYVLDVYNKHAQLRFVCSGQHAEHSEHLLQ
ncbi:hypothetical protein DPMN_093838 [Dreissena polymorpha]|uniref:Uncharacterized protein n=1 Tax=Dreissena polymorpha TaxID=45954 RepID=A0A9D4L4Y2_DREPO|nr:hypothetical protein DPMN_093838 [Dreissena polymorpha]